MSLNLAYTFSWVLVRTCVSYSTNISISTGKQICWILRFPLFPCQVWSNRRVVFVPEERCLSNAQELWIGSCVGCFRDISSWWVVVNIIMCFNSNANFPHQFVFLSHYILSESHFTGIWLTSPPMQERFRLWGTCWYFIIIALTVCSNKSSKLIVGAVEKINWIICNMKQVLKLASDFQSRHPVIWER